MEGCPPVESTHPVTVPPSAVSQGTRDGLDRLGDRPPAEQTRVRAHRAVDGGVRLSVDGIAVAGGVGPLGPWRRRATSGTSTHDDR